MTTSTRLRGKQGLTLSFKQGATAAVSTVADDVKKFELSFDDKDGDDLTFAEAAAGTGYDATLKLTGVTSNDAGSLYAYLWDNVGKVVFIDLGPYGNAAASATQPHYTGTATIGLPPNISNEAASGKDGNKGAEFEYEISYTTPIAKVTA